MGGMKIVSRDKKGEVKHDYNVFRRRGEGKIVEVDKEKNGSKATQGSN